MSDVQQLINGQWVPAVPLPLQDGRFLDRSQGVWFLYKVVNNRVVWEVSSCWRILVYIKGAIAAWNRRAGEEG